MDSVKMKGKTVDDAIEMALQVLGKQREEVEVKVISEGESAVLGVFGGKEAEVEVFPKVSAGEEARALIQEVLDKMRFLTIVSIKAEEGDTIQLEIKGEDMGRIIGRAGATIDALQYLSSVILSKKHAKRVRTIIDAEGYRARRQQIMSENAEIVAKEVEKTGKEQALPPMSASDRRLIHIFIQESHPNLTSYSKGEGANRQVVIAPKSSS